MNKKVVMISALVGMLMFAATAVEARVMHGDSFTVPRVAYSEPKDQSTVDLTGKRSLTFRWEPVPMPAGGREKFRFKIYKGFSYDVLVSQDPDGRTFSADVPSDLFENGQVYTWRVQQRDSRTMTWSPYDTWSFKVKK
ncbi:MAG: hypothetical protein PHI58_06130 [Candidatus Omnitrophica bacterium]|nr:hypothetical protein [Candidatus Omnitrophota bacterium]